MRLLHLSTEFTKKEKKKQKEKERTAATNLNSYKFCVDKREQLLARALVEESIQKAKDLGYSAIFLCGNPKIYSKLGFCPTFEFGIFHINDTDKNAHWCMVREIQKDSLEKIEGVVDIV